MQEFNDYTIPLMPFVLVAVLVVWSLWKKEKWIGPALLALSFSSGALVFMIVRQQTAHYSNFEVGFSIGMYASIVATIPLAAFGWYVGKKLSLRLSVLIAVVGLIANFLLAYAYQYKIKKNAETLKVEMPLECPKVPYHCAIRDNRLQDIPLLKKRGFDIEARDASSRSALWYGINNEEAVKILLENGANPDAFNMKNETPLAYVVVMSLKPNLSIGKLLVSHGAQVNRTIGFRKNISLLNFAIVNKNFEAINFLLENGADPYFIDGYKKSACLRMKDMTTDQVPNLKKYCPRLE